MEVRTVEPSEGELCARLGALVLASYLGLPGYMPEPDYEKELADVAGRAALPATEVLAAFASGEPLGCVTFVADASSPLAEHTEEGVASFRMLAVDPAAQGQGAGAALVSACIERARAAGRQAIVLHSTPWMTAAHRLYERFGFERDESLDWRPVPRIPLLGYRLALIPG
jgi:ribosomal protein S18 acetylase RimI-like enzyme